MKLTNILFVGLIALSITTTAQAENYKMETCVIAETAFWDAYKKAYADSEHSFIDILGDENKEAYFKLHKGELEKRMNEVRNRCRKMDPVVDAQYVKKMAELQDELNKLY